MVDNKNLKETLQHRQYIEPAPILQLATTTAARNGQAQRESQDAAGDITKKIKIEILDFEGMVDSVVSSDWINSIEEYFNRYDIGDLRRVRFTKIGQNMVAGH